MEGTSPDQLHRQVQAGLVRALQSRYRDVGAVATVARSLETWLCCHPDQASTVEQLSISTCYNALMFDRYAPVVQIGPIGLDASLIRAQPDEDRATGVLLALLTAPACLRQLRIREGQILLDDAAAMLDDLGHYGALQPYLQLLLAIGRADFAEAALERRDAEPHFQEALETASVLLSNRRRRRELQEAWSSALFGTGAQVFEDGNALVEMLLGHDLHRLYRQAAWGHARTAEDRHGAALEAIEACSRCGLPASGSPLELRPALLGLTPDDVAQHGGDLLGAAAALADGNQALRWSAAVRSSLAMALARSGERGKARRALSKAADEAVSCREADAAAVALGDRLVFDSSLRGAELALEDAEPFLMKFANAVGSTLGDPRAPAFRAQFDAPVERAIELAVAAFRERATPRRRRLLAVLLDVLRAPDPEDLRDVLGPSSRMQPRRELLSCMLDRLPRVRHALEGRPGTAALVAHAAGDHIVFIGIGGDRRSIRAEASNASYVSSAAALTTALRAAIESEASESSEEIAALGAAAFGELPTSIQDLIGRSHTIHLVPEIAGERGDVPYELLHDGQDFIGLSRIVSRHASLRDLVRTLEPRDVPLAPPQRAVTVAVGTPPGYPQLEFAESEARAVHEMLTEEGWQAEPLRERLEPELVLRAMELAGAVHIAAHGTVRAGGEAIVLGDRESLTVEDIYEKPRLLRAFVYLNACSLARDRYLGGGVSRGIASSLVGAGAPCVVANLLPVEDRRAAELSQRFYREALSHPVGEALRLARCALRDGGAPPSRWGTTILLADPGFEISGTPDASRQPRESAARLLFEATDPEAETAARRRAVRRAARQLEQDPSHPRLEAALHWARAMEEARAEPDTTTFLELARIARGLGSRTGEALALLYGATAHPGGDEEQESALLDRAILALEPLARVGPAWGNMHRECLTRRQKIDVPQELPFVDGPVSVNDPDDPAVQAVIALIRAVGHQQTRREGRLRLHRPEKTLADACWNAIVLGQGDRFSDGYAHIAFAIEMARKLVALGIVSRNAERHARWLLGGLVPYLWSTQSRLHLDHELAKGQAETLMYALGCASAAWNRPDASATLARLEPLVDEVNGAIERRQGDTSRFQRALDALEGGTEGATSGAVQTDAATSLTARLVEGIEGCGELSAEDRAEAAAWALGMLLETAHSASLRVLPDRGAKGMILSIHAKLLRDHAEGWFHPYLVHGFEKLRAKQYHFLEEWAWEAT